MALNTVDQRFQGVTGAPGLALGPAFLWEKNELVIPVFGDCDSALEAERLDKAIVIACDQIRALSKKMIDSGHPDEAEVFSAHLQLVQDKSLRKRVDKILAERVNAEKAWHDTVEAYAKQLGAMSDELFQLRAADLRDVGERVLRLLLNKPGDTNNLTRPSIIVARDLTPSETVNMNKDHVLAFCTADGGPTSHTAILAKALQVPAIVGLGDRLLSIAPDTLMLVDATKGRITLQPDKDEIEQFHTLSKKNIDLSEQELLSAALPAVTMDGKKFEIVANIGGEKDAVTALRQGAEGVGLFRTEFLFLERASLPNEEEQYDSYKNVFALMGSLPVVIRTLDAGGDKELSYLNLPIEANPFLGERAIRLCLSKPDLLKPQLRALLRAGTGHDLRIMFPMIATINELRQAKNFLEEAKKEVLANGHSLPDRIQIGIMIEIPAAALMADKFAHEVDFFSIGTNDLTQYTLAADRTNPKVAHLNDHCHPAVLRLIEQVTIKAHNSGIWVGVCGEMGGDPEALPVLIGIGIDELSMSPSLIPHAKSLIREMNYEDAKNLIPVALDQETAADVRHETRNFYETKSLKN